jgi:uncharacterized membrane protein YeaQ/YmgE (transglycosylase-associated protein family)
MEQLIPLLISLVSGGAGGNIIGALIKPASMGATGNSIVGGLGGLVAGWLLPQLLAASWHRLWVRARLATFCRTSSVVAPAAASSRW